MKGNLFCGQTADMFGVKDTNVWNKLTIHEVLEKALNNSATRFNYKDPVADGLCPLFLSHLSFMIYCLLFQYIFCVMFVYK